jgi:hypothetical protein
MTRQDLSELRANLGTECFPQRINPPLVDVLNPGSYEYTRFQKRGGGYEFGGPYGSVSLTNNYYSLAITQLDSVHGNYRIQISEDSVKENSFYVCLGSDSSYSYKIYNQDKLNDLLSGLEKYTKQLDSCGFGCSDLKELITNFASEQLLNSLSTDSIDFASILVVCIASLDSKQVSVSIDGDIANFRLNNQEIVQGFAYDASNNRLIFVLNHGVYSVSPSRTAELTSTDDLYSKMIDSLRNPDFDLDCSNKLYEKIGLDSGHNFRVANILLTESYGEWFENEDLGKFFLVTENGEQIVIIRDDDGLTIYIDGNRKYVTYNEHYMSQFDIAARSATESGDIKSHTLTPLSQDELLTQLRSALPDGGRGRLYLFTDKVSNLPMRDFIIPYISFSKYGSYVYSLSLVDACYRFFNVKLNDQEVTGSQQLKSGDRVLIDDGVSELVVPQLLEGYEEDVMVKSFLSDLEDQQWERIGIELRSNKSKLFRNDKVVLRIECSDTYPGSLVKGYVKLYPNGYPSDAYSMLDVTYQNDQLIEAKLSFPFLPQTEEIRINREALPELQQKLKRLESRVSEPY